MSFFLHTADLSGAAKTYEVSKIWAKKINKEFSRQFEEEIKLGLPQTAHFKGLDNDMIFHKNECGFRKFIILPLYETMKALDDGFFIGNKKRGLKVVNQVAGNGIELILIVVEETGETKKKKSKVKTTKKPIKKNTKNGKQNKTEKPEKKGKFLNLLISSL
jgi:hypothetical protein